MRLYEKRRAAAKRARHLKTEMFVKDVKNTKDKKD